MSGESEADIINMGAYLGRRAQEQNMAWIRKVQATRELEPYYRTCERLAELGGQVIDMAEFRRPMLRIVGPEDLQ